MKRDVWFLAALLMGCTGSLLAKTDSAGGMKRPFAVATLTPLGDDTAAGSVTFTRETNGIHIYMTVTGASPGNHGIHVHEKGDCSAADGSSAGGHYDPDQHDHGSPDPVMHHAGDLGNIHVDKDGSGSHRLVFRDEQMDAVDWSGFVGRAVILHSGEDDLRSQPSGDSGARIACGVIEAVDDSAAH